MNKKHKDMQQQIYCIDHLQELDNWISITSFESDSLLPSAYLDAELVAARGGFIRVVTLLYLPDNLARVSHHSEYR